MTRITILVTCAVFIFCFNPPIALSQPYYAPYLLLWHQTVENQAQIQGLQRQLADIRIGIGGLQKDLISIFELEQRLEEKEKSNQNVLKILLDELSKMKEEMGEIRKQLILQEGNPEP